MTHEAIVSLLCMFLIPMQEGGEGGRKGGRGGKKGEREGEKKSRRFMYTAVRHPPLIRKKKAPVSFATARAMRVFPVPGGP